MTIVKHVKALREAKTRKQTGLTLIDGERAIQRAYAAGIHLEKVFTTSKSQLKVGPQQPVSDRVFEKIAYGHGDEQAIAIAQVPIRNLAQLRLPRNPLILILEALEKPGNLGAILRTCDAAGVHAVLINDPKTDVYNPNVIRASIGTIFTVNVITATDQDILHFVQHHKLQLVGAFPAAKQPYNQVNLNKPLAIALGAEDRGLSDFWQTHCSVQVQIPMHGAVDSLNVSVTAGILIYEALRQRGGSI